MVLISCTKNLSRECAKVLKDWIKYVSNISSPLLSSWTIEKAGYWLSEHNDDLVDIKIGLVCIDKENKDNLWILFELGALVSRLGKDNVYIFLIDVDPEELQMPVSLIEFILPNKEGMKKLLYAINFELGAKGLQKRILDQVFEACWPWFEEKFKNNLIRFSSNLSERQNFTLNCEQSKGVLYPKPSLGNRLSQMKLRNQQLQSEKGLSRMELVERVSKVRLVDHIAFLIKQGLNPSEIADVLYPQPSLGNRLSQMKLRNEKLQSERDFSRMELVDRVSKVKLIDRIAFLIKKGLSLSEIAVDLEETAPREYIMDVSSFISENSFTVQQ